MNAEKFYKRFMVTLHPNISDLHKYYKGWKFNSGNYLFTTDTK